MTQHGRIQSARAYYDAIDGDDYDQLAGLLAPSFVHDRPDRTIEGRERFVQFMRAERPQTDTTHPLDRLYCSYEAESAEAETPEVIARGRLLAADGSRIADFVDVFVFVEDSDTIQRLKTYAR